MSEIGGNVDEMGVERLTQMDNAFLIYEANESPMHVASVGVFEAAPLRTSDGELDIERIEEYVLSRLPEIPRYRQRIERTPLRNHPVWVDDARFRLRYHLRHTRLPRPGDERQLKRLAGRILSQQLDMRKPLWEMWVVEGLEGDRIAVITKVHHCMVDGVSGAELLQTLLSPEPVEKIDPPPAWAPRRVPSRAQLAADDVFQAVRTPFEIGAGLMRLARDEDHARHHLSERLRAAGRLLGGSLGNASNTSINQPIGPHRRVDWLVMDLDRIRFVKNQLGGTVNDVVLATVAGAIRRFLVETRSESVADLDFRVMAPVSLRTAEESGQLGNRVAAWIVPLPIDEPDAVARLDRVRGTTEELKDSRQALGADVLSQVTEWTGPALLSLGTRLVTLGQPFNLVVTNVPGPQVPLYLLGARMLEAHPVVPLLGSLSTGIALFSYAGRLSWGFTADWTTVPDLHDMLTAVEASFDDLVRAAEHHAETGRKAS